MRSKKQTIKIPVKTKKSDNYPIPTMSQKEVILLRKVLNKFKSQINMAVELGSFEGGSSIVISRTLKRGAILYCIDAFVLNTSDARPRFLNDVLPNFKNMKLIESMTHEAAQTFTEPIDLLFVDACHQEHAIKEDSDDWLPKVKSGGVVLFHDYNNSDFPAVKSTVDERTVGWEVFEISDMLAVKIKP